MQLGDYAETKIVRCIKGSCKDFLLDLRVNSSTFMEFGVIDLNPENRNCACLPKGCAHGILTTSEDTEVIYLVDNVYNPKAEFGVSAKDKIFNNYFDKYNIFTSDKDSNWPEFNSDLFKNS